MTAATHASLVLARFGTRRKAGPIDLSGLDGLMFGQVGTDARAAATSPDSEEGYKFVLVGLHDSLESAMGFCAERARLAPWMDEADEVWAATLAPFRHFGEANYLDQDRPGPLFATSEPEPAPGTPIVVCTTAGFDLSDPNVMERAREFGAGVTGVRVSMTGVPGLHSQQTFFLKGGLQFDGLTVTIWRDFASMRDFAYKPGMHLDQLTRYRQEKTADRTSFTRFCVLRSEGTWHGSDPLAWPS